MTSFSRLLRPPVVLVALAIGVGLATGPAAAALADPFYSHDGCDISHSADGAVAGGSKCAGVDLSGAHLAQSDFDGADLTGADLKATDVQASTFDGAKLDGADFSGARIVGASFTGAGILPATLDVVAPTTDGTTVALTPVLPKGLTMTACTIAGEAVDASSVYPLGQTNVVCSFASSRPNEVATAVVQISVTNQATAAPPVPVFTPVASAQGAAPATQNQPLSSSTLMLLVVGAGVVVLLGIGGVVIRGMRSRRPRGRP